MAKYLRLLAAVSTTLALVGADDSTKPSEKVKERLGDKTIAILRGATKVDVFRISPNMAKKDEEKQIGGYPITATGAEQKKEFAAKLAAVLLEEKTYFGQQARCFNPGVAFRLWKDKESVDVVICFACTDLRLVSRDADGKEIKSTSGAFGPDIQPLLKLAKEAFPDDKEIQGIKEVKD
jgi:hypothetical protein